MRKNIIIPGFILLALVVTGASCILFKDTHLIATKITLASMFRNNMVLQREKDVPVWGKAQPGKSVKVSFASQEKYAVTGKDGTWMLNLDPMPASSDARDLVVDYLYRGKDYKQEDRDYSRTLHNVLVGEVWFCSGQSNMELGISGIDNSLEELQDADYPQIRLYAITKTASALPLDNISAVWYECELTNLTNGGWKGFSAVAFIFGRKLYNELKVPVGLIQAAYGGSAVTPFIAFEDLQTAPIFAQEALAVEIANKQYSEDLKKDKNASHAFDGIRDYSQLKPSVLFNSMVHPVTPYAIRGVLWYQGESNIGQGKAYTKEMQVLIASWRRAFGQGDFPFYYVQLPPYDYGGVNKLTALWEAQEACLSIPNTGMIVSVDAGDPKDIHPRKKRVIGERLALLALAKTYNQAGIAWSGPVFAGLAIDTDKAIISFDYTGSGLVAGDGKPLTWFTLAGDDKVFVEAQATIIDNTVVVQSPFVKKPVYVRYAWSDVASPNLYNKEGLPARPFRSDK